MKIILKLLSILIIAAILFLATSNLAQTLDLGFINKFYNIKFASAAVGIFIAGLVAGLAWLGADYLNLSTKLKEYQRKLEKTSVNADCDSSKVAVLESKIEVLEKALKSALEQNND